MQKAPVLNRLSLSQQISDALLDRIISGELKPGERLIELKIAQDVGTSQAPVREALRELEAVGVIEIQRNRGARVRVFDKKELHEIYSIRAELEGYASDLAARNTPEICERLEAILAEIIKAGRALDIKKFSTLNFEFHAEIINASGNATLVEMWKGLHVRSRTHFNTHINLSTRVDDLLKIAEAHKPIIDGIASGDPERARRVASEHVHNNMSRI